MPRQMALRAARTWPSERGLDSSGIGRRMGTSLSCVEGRGADGDGWRSQLHWPPRGPGTAPAAGSGEKPGCGPMKAQGAVQRPERASYRRPARAAASARACRAPAASAHRSICPCCSSRSSVGASSAARRPARRPDRQRSGWAWRVSPGPPGPGLAGPGRRPEGAGGGQRRSGTPGAWAWYPPLYRIGPVAGPGHAGGPSQESPAGGRTRDDDSRDGGVRPGRKGLCVRLRSPAGASRNGRFPGPEWMLGPPPRHQLQSRAGTPEELTLADRPRIPRITLARLMAAMVPLAAYLGLFVQGMRELDEPNPTVILILLALLALGGLCIAVYRRVTFLGGVVQISTSPLAVLAFVETFSAPSGPSRPCPCSLWLGSFSLLARSPASYSRRVDLLASGRTRSRHGVRSLTRSRPVSRTSCCSHLRYSVCWYII